MRVLIDTHIFIWFVNGAKELSPAARAIIEDRDITICISMVSLWEIAIKNALGKLKINRPYEQMMEVIDKNGFVVIPLKFEHTIIQHTLPWHHRDPFDRMIAAQAIAEQIDLISADPAFDAYFKAQPMRRLS